MAVVLSNRKPFSLENGFRSPAVDGIPENEQ
jgi:hypothetical protein